MNNTLKQKLWAWPDGLAWKLTEKSTIRSRKKRYSLFIKLIQPGPKDTILDIGVAPSALRGTNFLEQWYPHPQNIVALANGKPQKFGQFVRNFPKVKLVFGDGTNLQFSDNHFDIVFCNAVVEHVGSKDQQSKFIREICRVGKKVFVTTPNYWFPLEAHTLIPFAHWFSQETKSRIYRKLGRGGFADPNQLNLLTAKQFLSLFEDNMAVELYEQKLIGLTSNLVIVGTTKQWTQRSS